MLIRRSSVRLRPILLTALVSLAGAGAVACSAGSSSPIGAAVDANGNGIADDLEQYIWDPDGDGLPNEFDLFGDGTVVGPGFDTDGDGNPDGVGVDSDGDGVIDGIDTDGDGIADIKSTPPGSSGSGGGAGLAINGPSTGGATGNFCQENMVDFVPKTPTVMVLVDRSGSIYDLGLWDDLRNGVLPVIEDLQNDVRFGFATYGGTSPTCEMAQHGTVGLGNYQSIADAYIALGDSKPSGKLETPTAKGIEWAAGVLKADMAAPGDRFILLVTGDDDPDFCDDSGAACGADSTVAAAQTAAAQGVKTLVFAIDGAGVENPTWFDYYAQAGVGELPNWDKGLAENTLHYECSGKPDWESLRTANGNGMMMSAGNYSAGGGTAKAFLNADVTQLVGQLRTAVEGLKSCVFDMTGNVEVKAGSESTGEVKVNDQVVPADQWKMNSPTILEITGEACTLWQSPEVTKFFAGFPCEALVVK